MTWSVSRIRIGRLAGMLLATSTDAGAQRPLPIYDVREEIRIASNETAPGMALTAVHHLAVLPDGRIITVHRDEAVVRIFAADGRLARVVGRRGDGPGEFRRPVLAGYVLDTIWVHDATRRRYVRVRADGELTDLLASPGGGAPLGLTSATTSLRASGSDSMPITVHRGETGVRILPVTRRIAGHRFDLRDEGARGRRGGRGPETVEMYSPLAVGTLFELAPGGHELVVVEPGELWGGRPGQFAIERVQTATGDRTGRVVVSLPAKEVTRSAADSLIAEQAERMGRLGDQFRANARVPRYYPAVGEVVVGGDGILWTSDPAEPRTWVVVDRAGTPLMRVRVPAGFRVFAVSRTHVWGTVLDSVDLPIVVRYRVLDR